MLPPIRNKARVALMKLPAFQEIDTEDLIAMARAMPGGTKVSVPDRLTAIVLLIERVVYKRT